MSKIDAKSTQSAYIAEVTAGVTPATPAWKVFRAVGESLEIGRKLAFSSELDGRRGEKNYSVAARMASGGLKFEMSNSLLDDFLESALRNAWSTNVLTDAQTAKTFSLETKFEGGASDLYKRIKGAEVNTLSLNMKAGEITTGEVSFVGLDGDYDSAIVTGATYTAGATTTIFNGADFGALAMSGLTIGCMASLDLTISNNLSPLMCLGNLAATDMNAGKLEVTGNLTILASGDEYDVLRAGADVVSTSLYVELGRTAGSKTRIELPVIVLEDMMIKSESADGGTVLITSKFRALQASSISNSVIRATRAV